MANYGPDKPGIADEIHEIGDHVHSVSQCWPNSEAPITVTAGVGAWTVGDAATITETPTSAPFDAHWVVVSAISANDDYELILYDDGSEVARIPFTRGGVQVTSYQAMVQMPIAAKGSVITAKLMSGTGETSCKVKLVGHTY